MTTQIDLQYISGHDYSHGSVSTTIAIDSNIYPIAFQPEYVPSDGALYETGRQAVLLAHPDYGNILFFLRFTEDRWQLDEPEYQDEPVADPGAIEAAYAFDLTPALLQDCITAMEHPIDLDFYESMDYSSQAFVSTIQLHEDRYPAAFQPEFFPNEGSLHPTHRMIVLLAHSAYGNIAFFMRAIEHHWVLDLPDYKDEPLRDADTIAAAYPFELSTDIIEQCSQSIVNAHA